MEGHVQIKQCITEKQLKLIEFVQLLGKISIQNFLEKSLEFFFVNKHPIFTSF